MRSRVSLAPGQNVFSRCVLTADVLTELHLWTISTTTKLHQSLRSQRLMVSLTSRSSPVQRITATQAVHDVSVSF